MASTKAEILSDLCTRCRRDLSGESFYTAGYGEKASMGIRRGRYCDHCWEFLVWLDQWKKSLEETCPRALM